MPDEKRFLVDVGLNDLPFPIRASSRVQPDGQPTIATISINARIMQQFEARWIDKFIGIVHRHRERIGTKTILQNILVYLSELNATHVHGGFSFPFFVEKLTPVSKEKCLVQFHCHFEAHVSSIDEKAKARFRINVPCITTFPGSDLDNERGLFGQLSVFTIEVESAGEVFPEDIVDLVDRHALAPMYSFITEEDKKFLINKIHTEQKCSVTTLHEIREELARKKEYTWYSVRSANYGILHSYSTVIGAEKSMWVPMSGYDEDV